MQQLAAQEIGERIKAARLETGLTQDELSDLVDVTMRTVQAWEAGDNIPYRKLNKLAEVLGREVGWFLHGEPEVVTDDEARLREIVHEELEEVREAMARIEELLEEPPRPRRAST